MMCILYIVCVYVCCMTILYVYMYTAFCIQLCVVYFIPVCIRLLYVWTVYVCPSYTYTIHILCTLYTGAYPFIAKQILTSNSKELRALLKSVIIESDTGRIKWVRQLCVYVLQYCII